MTAESAQPRNCLNVTKRPILWVGSGEETIHFIAVSDDHLTSCEGHVTSPSYLGIVVDDGVAHDIVAGSSREREGPPPPMVVLEGGGGGVIVERLINGHIGISHFVLYREVVLSLEVKMY